MKFFLPLLLVAFGFLKLDACTGIRLTAKDGASVSGRTLEFGMTIDTSIAVVPRKTEFQGTTPLGQGMKYQAKYAAVGAICFGEPALMDGMNEKGLVVGTFYFPGFAGYRKATAENQPKALSPIEFPNWILTQFSTLEEVKEAVSQVVIVPTVVKAWGDEAAPFHYIVYDKNGKSLVIEPIDGDLIVHENTIGTFTNSPEFGWHMTNLRNFIHLSTFNANPIMMGGLELAPFGQGSGMVGLPGDFTPPSRFVRAAIFSSVATPSETADEAVFQAFHILNQFDIPVGVAKQKSGGVINSDYTMITTVKNPQTLTYYFKTYDDQSIKVVDLSKFDLDAASVKKISTAGFEKAQDISSTLK